MKTVCETGQDIYTCNAEDNLCSYIKWSDVFPGDQLHVLHKTFGFTRVAMSHDARLVSGH